MLEQVTAPPPLPTGFAIISPTCFPAEAIIMRRLDEHAVTLLTFSYARRSVLLIALSALLGILVTFSTFLVIECTPPSVYGHVQNRRHHSSALFDEDRSQ
jgi:hypothetical protein